MTDQDFIGDDALERKQAADLLHLTADSFSSMIARGELRIPYVQVGRRKRIYSRRQIIEFLHSRRVVPEVA